MNLDTHQMLISRHCQIWNERNQFERIPAIVETYSTDIAVVAPDFTAIGWVKVGNEIGQLHNKFPDCFFTFSPAIEGHHNIVKLDWSFGVQMEKAAIKGWTVAVINNYCIQSLYTFYTY